MTQEHPIAPPEELVDQWNEAWIDAKVKHEGLVTFVATQAARWGADQELEACVEWMGDAPVIWRGDPEEHPGFYLKEARRPKPPSLKEQALDAWDRLRNEAWCEEIDFDLDFVRQALESLPS